MPPPAGYLLVAGMGLVVDVYSGNKKQVLYWLNLHPDFG